MIPLADRFLTEGENAAAGTSGSFQKHVPVVRGGRQKDAMILIAPVTVRACLAGLSGKLLLKLTAAPVYNIGDGMQLEVLAGRSGEETPVFRRYFDAGRNAADRGWTPLEIPLDAGSNGAACLEVRVSGGPQGDLICDWLALADVRIEQNR